VRAVDLVSVRDKYCAAAEVIRAMKMSRDAEYCMEYFTILFY
jgi:hypothetical protein